MKPDLTLTTSEFKRKCLAVMRDLEARKLSRVVVTRRGKPVAELRPTKRKVPSLWGCMRGTVNLPPNFDLTAPVLDEPLDAAKGILHR